MTRVGANQQSPICMDYHKLHCLSGEKLRLWAAGQGRKGGWGPRRQGRRKIYQTFLSLVMIMVHISYSLRFTAIILVVGDIVTKYWASPQPRRAEDPHMLDIYDPGPSLYTHILPCLLRILIFLCEGDYNEPPRQSERSHLMESYNNNCWHKLWRLHQNVTIPRRVRGDKLPCWRGNCVSEILDSLDSFTRRGNFICSLCSDKLVKQRPNKQIHTSPFILRFSRIDRWTTRIHRTEHTQQLTA